MLLSEKGQAFAETHYDGYVNDVGRQFVEELDSRYDAEDSDACYRRMADALYERWARSRPRPSAPDGLVCKKFNDMRRIPSPEQRQCFEAPGAAA